MQRVIEQVGPLKPLKRKGTLFAHLTHVITAQQVSIAAAETIHGRVVAACGGTVTPATLRAAGPDALRAAGCSRNKARYLTELAQRLDDGELKLGSIARLSDDETRQRLLSITGLGPWSVEMVQIFRLGRPDVFSPGDIGLRRAMERLYDLPRELTDREWKQTAAELTAPWAPYRSTGSRYLWAWIDGDNDIAY